MSKRSVCASLAIVLGLAVLCEAVHAQSEPDLTGIWMGTAYQNEGASNYSVVLTITPTSAKSEYPDLDCAGMMTRIGASGGYVFFSEAIEPSRSGHCINGTVTVALASGKLAWGWFGSFQGKPYVAWALLTKQH